MMAGLDRNTESIRALVDQRLKAVAAAELSRVPGGPHLDEDVIAAFVEGRLREDECSPVLSHLAACSLCRRTSAQIVQFENQIDDEPVIEAEEPGHFESLWSKFNSLLSSGEDVVFAYQNPDEDEASTDATGREDESKKE